MVFGGDQTFGLVGLVGLIGIVGQIRAQHKPNGNLTAEGAERRGGRYNECGRIGGNDRMCRSEVACVAAVIVMLACAGTDG